MRVRLTAIALAIVAFTAVAIGVFAPDSVEDSTLLVTADAETTAPAPETTTTVAPTTTAAPTTTVAPTTTTAPPPPLAPSCATWASQADADAWMAANAAAHNTSNIDTDGDGRACTRHFAPKPTPKPATSSAAPAPTGGGSGCVIPAYICQRESGHEGYSALNESSGAGGMYQFMPSTWNAIARAIAPEWVGTPPHLAPPAVQDQFATYLWNGGAGASHWACC